MAWRAPMHGVVVWAAVLAAGAAALAQTPNAAPPAAGMTSEPLAEPAATDGAPAASADTPTHRSTRTATPTSESLATATATAADTERAAVATATSTPVRPGRPSATVTTAPVLPSPLTATPARFPMGLGVGADGAALTLVGGGMLALLAVWVGARIAGARDRAERRRARRTLATTMLLELRRLDAVLRRVVALDNVASFPSLDHPIIEAALRDLTFFQSATAARIAQFHGALLGIQHEISDYRDNPLRWAGRLGELNQLIKGRAAAAVRAVPELVRALEREGGAPPPHLSEPPPPSAGADRSVLPPPPFGAGDGDDWTF